MLTLVLVGVGGAVGAIGRYLVTSSVQSRVRSSFPWGTYAVNLSGSLAIGVVFGLFDGGAFADDVLAFLVSGILGGYTTFSTFSVENLKLIETRHYGSLLHNTVGQVATGLVLAAIGYWLGSTVV